MQTVNATLFFQDGFSILRSVWSYLTYPFTLGRITVSAASLFIGLIVLAITFSLARAGSSLIERRLERRRQNRVHTVKAVAVHQRAES